MAVTTGYSWTQDGNFHLMNNLFTAGNQFLPQVAANASRTEYFGVWSDGGNGFQAEGRVMAGDETPVSDEFTINEFNNAGLQFDADVAGLADGNFVAVYNDLNADLGGDIVAVLRSPEGFERAFDFSIDASTADDFQPRVAALSNGGFAVTWTRNVGGGNFDIRTAVFNADGSPKFGPELFPGIPLPNFTLVDGSPGQQQKPDVAGLGSGKFVVVWEDDSNHTVYFRILDSFDVDVGFSRTPIDGIGTVNTDIHVVGLSDGGFAVAYTDNGWGISGTEITFQIFNSNGTARTGFIRANNAALGGLEAGDQDRPTITTLGNGMIVVGWQHATSGATFAQVFDAAGNAIGTNQGINDHAVETDFAGLSDASMAVVLQSTNEDGFGNGNSIRTGVDEFTRTFFSDGAGDTIVSFNDGLRQVFNGGGGSDTVSYATAAAGVTANLSDSLLNTGSAAHDSYNAIENLAGSAFNDKLVGDAGANVLTGGAGNDAIDGRGGDDTAAFSRRFNESAVMDFGTKLVVAGPEGTDTLTAIEHLRFADTTITPAEMADDGNPLFDTLYYLSRNPDVFHAGVNALDHFNAFGSHEGRNPNGFFDTSEYLSVYRDAAASGMNPLEHFDQTGWREGHDPSANFDTRLYLAHNPDVAAAGVDPLLHFLLFGFAEGRQAFAAIGDNIVGGFDAEFYLRHNPDVAAAGVDPLAHFNTFGWHEGRNPNSVFDTAGYLSHYADVAKAGINPLEHYEQFGWREGRDPSAHFDTLGYLRNNPDVAAAHINPLDHYLTFGIYEGRQAVDDGLFH